MDNEPRGNLPAVQEMKKNTPEAMVEEWKARPVFIASTSEARIEGLKRLGFQDVHAFSPPEAVETQAFAAYHESYQPTGAPLEGFGSDAPEHVAKEKLAEGMRTLVADHPEMKTGMFVAFDTLAHHYQYVGDHLLAFAMTKPENVEIAKQLTEEVLAVILLHLTSQKPVRSPEESERAFALNIKTAMAMKLPDEMDIRVSSVKTYLHPQRLISLADQFRNQIDIAKLADALPAVLSTLLPGEVRTELATIVSELMKAISDAGGDVTKIAGGIDYTIPEVRAILGIEKEVDEGILRGFPGVQFDAWLLKVAKEKILSEVKT